MGTVFARLRAGQKAAARPRSRSRSTRRARTWRPSRLPPGALRPFALASDRRRRPPTDPPPSEPPSTLPGGAPPSPPPAAAPPPAEKPKLDHDTAIEAMRFYPLLLGWVRRFGVRRHDAPDVAMEVVIRAVRRWDTLVLRADEHPLAERRKWLFVIAYRAASAWRKSPAHARVELREPSEMEVLAGQGKLPSPEEAALERDGERVVKAALAALRPQTSDENWRAFIAHEIAGVAVPEIAKLEGVAASTIYTRLHLARRDLRAAIQRLRARVTFEQTSAKRRGSR